MSTTAQMYERIEAAKARGEDFITITKAEHDAWIEEIKPLFASSAPVKGNGKSMLRGCEIRIDESPRS